MLVEIWLCSQIIVFCLLQVGCNKTHIPSLFPYLLPYPNVLYNTLLVCLFIQWTIAEGTAISNKFCSFLDTYESNVITDNWSHFKFMSTNLKWVHNTTWDPTTCLWQVYSSTLWMSIITSHLPKPPIALLSHLQFMVLTYSSLRKQKQMRTSFHHQICQPANTFCLSSSRWRKHPIPIKKTTLHFVRWNTSPFTFSRSVLQWLSIFPVLHLSLSTGPHPNMINTSHLEKNPPLNTDCSRYHSVSVLFFMARLLEWYYCLILLPHLPFTPLQSGIPVPCYHWDNSC